MTESAGKKEIVYTVHEGDSLVSISRTYGVTVDDIRTWNPEIGETETLITGLKLKLYL